MVPKKTLSVLALVILGTIAFVTVALATVGPVGNGYYAVFVEDTSGIGRFAARTGVNHPITIQTGSAQNVIFGGQAGSPGTSYMTIRSYTSQTDYVDLSGTSPVSSMTVRSLDPFGAVSDIGTTGARTTWTLPGDDASPDDLTIARTSTSREQPRITPS